MLMEAITIRIVSVLFLFCYNFNHKIGFVKRVEVRRLDSYDYLCDFVIGVWYVL